MPPLLIRKISPPHHNQQKLILCVQKLAQPTDNILHASLPKCHNSPCSLEQIWWLCFLFWFLNRPENLSIDVFCIVYYNSFSFQNINLNLFIYMFDLHYICSTLFSKYILESLFKCIIEVYKFISFWLPGPPHLWSQKQCPERWGESWVLFVYKRELK